ncbi:MAG: hypothetical protein AB1394_01710 [Bacteroidota bacterium]
MKKLVLLLAAGLLVSCSSKDYFIVPEYADKRIEKASLIIPTVKEFNISQDEYLFAEEELMAINKQFVESINSKLLNEIDANSTFNKIDFVDIEGRISKENVKLPYTKGGSIHLNLPTKPLSIAGTEQQNLYILFFDQISLSIYKKQRETSDPAKHYTASTPAPTEARLTPAKLMDQVFACEIKFALYNNQLGKPVAYAIKIFEERISENHDIEKLVDKFVDKIAAYIVKDSPFKK